jgi:hypothetical protein
VNPSLQDKLGGALKALASGMIGESGEQMYDRLGTPPVQMGTVQPSIGPGIMELAMQGVMGKRSGDPAADVDRGVNIIAHGISNGASSIPSGGPTSNINYADLPGKYGRLVDPPGGPADLRLQKGAWQSLHSLGVPADAILGGSYRTNAQQRAYYAKDPQRYAPPGMSLHEYGLAIDMNSAYIDKYADALLSNGWYRERSDEPWHFSYGVFTPAPGPTVAAARTQGGGQRNGGGPGAGNSARPLSTPASPRRPSQGSHQQL